MDAIVVTQSLSTSVRTSRFKQIVRQFGYFGQLEEIITFMVTFNGGRWKPTVGK